MIFSVENLRFRYAPETCPAIDGVTLDFHQGLTTVLLGLSGSGKSTLLNLLGLLWEGKVDEGRIGYFGDERRLDYAELSAQQKVEIRLRHFGFVLQSSYMLPHFSCLDNVAMPLALQGFSHRHRAEAAERLLADADPSGVLVGLKDRPARMVSGGQRQRLAVLRALIHNPRIVFADEPASSLDFFSTKQILALLHHWQSGVLHSESSAQPRTLVIVSHGVDVVFDMGDKFVVMHRGQVAGRRAFAKGDLPAGAADLYRLIETGA